MPDDLCHVAIVTPSADRKMRRQQNIQMQLLQQLGIAFEARIDQQGRLMRIGDDFLDQTIAAVGRVADDSHPETALVQVLSGGIEIAPLFVEEGLAVGYQKLQIAHLRLIDSGEINLVQNSRRHGEPYSAHRRVGGANRVLGAAAPSRRNSRRAAGSGGIEDYRHVRFRFLSASESIGLFGNRGGRRVLRLQTKRIRDADTQRIEQQQWNREKELRNHIGRSQRGGDNKDREDRIADVTYHHLIVDHAKLGEKEREDRHLEGQRERQEQLGRERQVLAYPNRRRNPDARVLSQKKCVANLENYRPAEISAERKKSRRKKYERLRHLALLLVQSRRDEFPDFVKNRGTRDEQA